MNKPKTENKATYDSNFNIWILCRAWHGLVLRDISPIPLRYRSPLVQLEFDTFKCVFVRLFFYPIDYCILKET